MESGEIVCDNFALMDTSTPKAEAFQALSSLERKVEAFIRAGEGDFGELLLEAHAMQRTLCPSYGAYCAQQPKPLRWEDIPALPLSAFRHAAIRCFSPEKTVCSFRTSGTTGEGYGTHDLHSLTLYQAAALQGWSGAGLPGRRVLCLLPPPREAPHSSLSRMAGWLADEGHFFSGRWDALERALGEGETPPVLFGTALAFLDFFEGLGGRRILLPAGSLAVETGGYKGTRRSLSKAALYAQFEDRLGLSPDSIWNEYGMTELSSQFYTRGLGRPHRGAPWVRAQVLDPETNREVADGETGALRLFDLANTGSCCVLQTQDLAIRRGDAFELLGRDPAALPRGCSRAADALFGQRPPAGTQGEELTALQENR